jgi:peptidoglycan/LPS O-acetylase OafA/YrhL
LLPTGASELPGEGRLVALDGLRALSILLVLAAHLLPLGPKQWQINVAAGSMGMSLFFALSGFLIFRALERSAVFDFLVKRAARVLPLVYAYIVIVGLLYPMSPAALLGSFGLYLNYRPDLMLPVTEHLWSLGVELHFYIGMAILAAIHRKALVPMVWIACFGITMLRIIESTHTTIVTHLRLDELLIGACIATLRLPSRPSPKRLMSFWLLAMVFWAIASHPAASWLQYLRPYSAGLLLAFTLLNLPAGRLAEWLCSAPARYIASISYALYVIHPLTAHGWWNSGSIGERYLLKRPLGIAITFVLAHVSTFFWERWWNRSARRWLAEHKPFRSWLQRSTSRPRLENDITSG